MAKKPKKEKGKKEKKKKEKKVKAPQFAYDKAISALGGMVCLYAVFAIAAIVFSVVYGILFAG